MQRIVSFTKSMPNGKQAPVKRSTKSAAARNDALLDTRADGVHTARVGDRTADHPNNRIFFRLFQVGNTLQRQAVKELGVTTVQWAVLGALSDPRPKSGIKSGISLSTLGRKREFAPARGELSSANSHTIPSSIRRRISRPRGGDRRS